jgi:MFS family permease
VTAADRAEAQRRVTRVLVAGQLVGAAGLASATVVGAFVVQDILGPSTPWGGVASATFTLGAALMSVVLAQVMAGATRRRGLAVGYGAAVVGGLVAGLGAQRRSLPVFLAGLVVYGGGQAANYLARYAATDLAPPERRGAAMSRILFASTFGAVLGPLLVRPAEWAGEEWFGWRRYTGPWVFAAAFFVVAALNVALRLRPDPLDVLRATEGAHGRGASDPVDAVDARRATRGALALLGRVEGARRGAVAMVISQATMVAVMTMTPVHLKSHGHEAVSPWVVSLHIAGMFAFSPLVGAAVDRRGRRWGVLVAAALLVAANVLASVAGDGHLLLFPSLWLLGVGWNFGLIAGSSMLVDAVPAQERVRVQGAADLMMSLCGATAGFASGFIRAAVGFRVLALLALVLAAWMGVLAWRTPATRPAVVRA